MVIRRGEVTNHDIRTACFNKPQMSEAQGSLELFAMIRKCIFFSHPYLFEYIF